MSSPQVSSQPPALSGDAEVARFRRAMARFATGVTVVTTVVNGTDHAMTASAFLSVSLEPLLVLVSVEQEARIHDAIISANVWGVSILDDTARPASQWLATRGRPLHGQLDRVPHHRGSVTGVAILDQSLAALECRTTISQPAGDHTLVVGEVLSIELPDAPGLPLLYHRGGYTRLH